MNKRPLTVPVNADTAKANALREDAQRHRIHAAVLRPPIGGEAVQVATGLAALDRFAAVVADAAVARSDFDFLPQLLPDGLELVCQLNIDHLGAAAAGTLKLIPLKILGEFGMVIAAKRNNRHLEFSPFTQNRAFPAVRHRPG